MTMEHNFKPETAAKILCAIRDLESTQFEQVFTWDVRITTNWANLSEMLKQVEHEYWNSKPG